MTIADDQSEKSLGQQNYEQFADRYAFAAETKAHNAYYDRPATLSLLPDVDGRLVLDAGCGPGIYAEWLLNRGADVIAFDVTPRMVELAQERIGQRFSDRFMVQVGDLNQPLDWLQAETFDMVLCPLVLDYIEDWGPVFREFYRVLKAGGLLVFSAGHPFGDFLFVNERLKQRSSYFDTDQYECYWKGFGEPYPLVKEYRRPLSAMLNPLIAVGFKLDTVLEPVPTEVFKAVEPEDYEKLTHRPGFICIRAKK
ncbi:MAG: class I SAM-dependent methyltransferase [Burkholderiales bacterium]|nr:class I SAM-dependent methyltransferase [Anaerolineae bacterium]